MNNGKALDLKKDTKSNQIQPVHTGWNITLREVLGNTIKKCHFSTSSYF